MFRSSLHVMTIAVGVVLLALIARPTHAAVLPVTAATFVNDAGDPVTGEQFNNTYVDSLTSGGVVYSALTGATVTTMSAEGTVFHPENEPLPTPSEALSGLNLGNSVANVDFVNFSLGTVVNAGADFRFFMFELQPSDSITVTPLDLNGDAIDGWTLALEQTDYGPLVLTVDVKMNNGLLESDALIAGVTFGLDDFTGGTGQLTGVAGLGFSGNTGWDPAGVGLAAVPEPSTGWLSLLVSVGVVSAWRRGNSRGLLHR